MIYSGWQLAGENIQGPDNVRYGERVVVGTRLDRRNVRQGMATMDWSYQVLDDQEMERLLQIWRSHTRSIQVRFFNPQGEWETRVWSMQQPQIGRRSGFLNYSVSVRFTPFYYSGAAFLVQPGLNPDPNRFPNTLNDPPIARIEFSAAVWGDPEITVRLNGSGSSDADGIIMTYAWADNEDAFQALDGFSGFTPPHIADSAETIFVYEYLVGMPNPRITLTVSDNAGQSGSSTVEVDIQSLFARSAIAGKTFATCGGAVVYVSTDGGLTFQQITGFEGNALRVACAPSAIVWGTDTGKIYRSALSNLGNYRQVHDFGSTHWVTALVASAKKPSWLAAGTNKAALAVSTSKGRGWGAVVSPGIAVSGLAFNLDNPQQLWAVGTDNSGGIIRVSPDRGQTWDSSLGSQLPTGSTVEARAVAANNRIWYAGVQGTTTAPMFANGTVVTGINTPADMQAMSMITDGKAIAGDIQGRAYRIEEAQVRQTKQMAPIQAIAQDPTNDAVMLFATQAGLWKSLNNLESVGVLALPGVGLGGVDFMREAPPAQARVAVPTWGAGGTTRDGVWLYRNAAEGWTLRSGDRVAGRALPVGIFWWHLTSDPNDADTWLLVGNTTESIEDNRTNVPDYKMFHVTREGAIQRIIMQYTDTNPVSPFWITRDAGLTWDPIFVSLPRHGVAHGGTKDWFCGVSIVAAEFDPDLPNAIQMLGTAITVSTPFNTAGSAAILNARHYQDVLPTSYQLVPEPAAWFWNTNGTGVSQIGEHVESTLPYQQKEYMYVQVGGLGGTDTLIGYTSGQAGRHWFTWAKGAATPTRMIGAPATNQQMKTVAPTYNSPGVIAINGTDLAAGDDNIYGTIDVNASYPTSRATLIDPGEPMALQSLCHLKDGVRVVTEHGPNLSPINYWRVIRLPDMFAVSNQVVELTINSFCERYPTSVTPIWADRQVQETCALVLRTQQTTTGDLVGRVMTVLVYDEAGWHAVEAPFPDVVFSKYAVLPFVKDL